MLQRRICPGFNGSPGFGKGSLLRAIQQPETWEARGLDPGGATVIWVNCGNFAPFTPEAFWRKLLERLEAKGYVASDRGGKVVSFAATIGREGALGVHCGFGIFHAQTRAVVEIPGAGLRMPAVPFQKCVRESERLRDLLIRYREFRLAETQQLVACNALHAAEGRLARWLLHTSDIIGSDIVPLTQEFLSQVLGVRRTTVTTLARNLLRTGVIRYSRGRIEICDREQLKNFVCECYEVLHRLPAQMLPRPKR